MFATTLQEYKYYDSLILLDTRKYNKINIL